MSSILPSFALSLSYFSEHSLNISLVNVSYQNSCFFSQLSMSCVLFFGLSESIWSIFGNDFVNGIHLTSSVTPFSFGLLKIFKNKFYKTQNRIGQSRILKNFNILNSVEKFLLNIKIIFHPETKF